MTKTNLMRWFNGRWLTVYESTKGYFVVLDGRRRYVRMTSFGKAVVKKKEQDNAIRSTAATERCAGTASRSMAHL